MARTERSLAQAGSDGRPLQVVPPRHPGQWVAAAALLAVAAYVVKLFATGDIEWSVVGNYLTLPIILHGLWRTFEISILSMLLGLVLGGLLAMMRLSTNPVASLFSWFYVWLFRGTPVYLQLLMWFNLALILPVINIPGLYHARTVHVMTPFLGALLGLGLNEAAYMAEIFRSGILAVGEGQLLAAQALGMTPTLRMRRIVMPQAVRIVTPTIGNQFIQLLKTSSLASTIAFPELMYYVQQIYYTNDKVIELLIVSAIWYLALVSVFSIGQYYLERYFRRGTNDPPPGSFLRHLRRNVDPRRTPMGPGGSPATAVGPA